HPVFSPHLLSPASASDTTEVIGAVGGSVTFRSHNAGSRPAFWSFGNNPIVTVAFGDPPRSLFYKDKLKTRFAVSKRGRALTISQLSVEDAGTYSVKVNKRISTFTLRVYSRCFLCWFGVIFTLKKEVSDPPVPAGELAEPRVTCEAQNCSDGICLLSLRCSVPGAGFGNVSYSWSLRGEPRDGAFVLLVWKSSLREPEPLTCTARNAVSSRNVTVTTPGVLCS
ncbi:SLAF7 protein, partial [Locustella ochotensis]|nr:SLAF7 protein [Locustella ochotensis]